MCTALPQLSAAFARGRAGVLDSISSGRLCGLGGAGLCLIAAALLSPWRPGIVDGRSMEPTLPPGSLFAYDRGYYRTHSVRRGCQ